MTEIQTFAPTNAIDNISQYKIPIIFKECIQNTIDTDRKDNFPNNKKTIYENINFLFDLKKLSYNWDGYGSGIFTEELIHNALLFLGQVNKYPIQPDIFPTGRNSIQFEYEEKNDNYLEFELFNNKISIYSKINNEEFESNLSLDDQNLITNILDVFFNVNNLEAIYKINQTTIIKITDNLYQPCMN